jgi:hypothetical protein
MATARVQSGWLCSNDRLAPECRLLAHHVIRRAAPFMVALGVRADIGHGQVGPRRAKAADTQARFDARAYFATQ